MQLELFSTTTDTLETFIRTAAKSEEVKAAARNWYLKRGGKLHPEDIRLLRAALKQIDGYGNWIWEYADFMDSVAYGVVACLMKN